jgi:FkbH-like protein
MTLIKRPADGKPVGLDRAVYLDHNGFRYRTPVDLCVSPSLIKHVLVVGSCLTQNMAVMLHKVVPDAIVDFELFNHARELHPPPRQISDYQFQVVGLALRSIYPDNLLMHLRHNDIEGHERAFEEATTNLQFGLAAALKHNRDCGLITFVLNFCVPQQNHIGRLFPKYDLRNPSFFVEELNRELWRLTNNMSNVHLIDVDDIASAIGKRHVHDDIIYMMNHGSVLSNWDYQFDSERLQPPLPLDEHYEVFKDRFLLSIWSEIEASYRTICQQDQIKLAIFDLDDTMWRGVIAETGVPPHVEGWPLGILEAALTLKKRGVLLAIASKNDHETIAALWNNVFGHRLPMTDFVSIKINWNPKSENVGSILKETNLLPNNAVFIDDNPVERAAVQSVFPEIRVLGQHLYYLRRVLLWAPETQVTSITSESALRTEMVQRQIQREASRSAMTHADFLDSLNVQISLHLVTSITDPAFARAFELVNKTNQFDTTGKRWSSAEIQELFASGGRFVTFTVEDKFTSYGLVGVVIMKQSRIEQFVMSCRVIGLDVETSIIARLATECSPPLTGAFIPTEHNRLCADLFSRCGFKATGDLWST